MDGNRSPLASYSPSSPARILIAEYDSAMLESFGTLANNMLEIDCEFSTSRDHAMRKVLASPYNLIISGVYLAELDDFQFVKQSLSRQSSIPVVITAKASDRDSARLALKQGALDVIANPLDPDQALATIRLALWHNTLLELIARKEKTAEMFQHHLARCPVDREMNSRFVRTLLAMEQSIAAYKKTMERMEGSLVFLNSLASDIQKQTRERALERVDTSLS